MKHTISAVLSSMVATVAPVSTGSNLKIGVVDLQRAVSETKEGISAKAWILPKL